MALFFKMAEFDKADPRWLVKDMGQGGTNVNNWHWREYDALPWAKNALQESYEHCLLLPDHELVMKVTSVEVTGEAAINNRKNKLIPAYELSVKLDWSCEGRTGLIKLPYLADENHLEEPEISFAASGPEDELASKLKSAFYSSGGKATVLKIIMEFLAEIRAGGPLKPGAKGLSDALKDAEDHAARKDKVKLADVRDNKKAAADKAAAEGGRSLSLTERYYCRPEDLFTCFMIEGKVRAFTQSNASVDPRVGGQFKWFNGSVEGEFTEISKDSKLDFTWRFTNWPDDVSSKVSLTLKEPEPGTTILSLHQTGIPEEDRFGQAGVFEHVEKGWNIQVFTKIRQVFGYGV
jgi:activator of HSP90 ATPase